MDLSHRSVLVVGAGIMGAGIAQVAAQAMRQAGQKVYLHDAREGAALQAGAKLAATLQSLVEKGRLSQTACNEALQRIVPVGSLAEARDAGLVVEAIVERLDAKRALFSELESVMGPDCVLATNTSSISVTAIANGLILEFYRDSVDPMWGKVYLETLGINDDGTVSPPEVPGIGAEPNYKELEKYRLSHDEITADS